MTNTTMTKVQALEAVLAGNITDAVIEKISAMLDSEKSRKVVKKPTANQIANVGFKADILSALEADTLYSVADIMKAEILPADVSNQRVTALMRALVADGSLVKVEDKRKTFYRLAE